MEECYKVDIPQHSMPLEAILGRNFMYVSIQIPWSPSRTNVFIRWGVHNSASPVEEIRTRPRLTFPALTKVGMERHVQWIITQRSIGTDPGGQNQHLPITQQLYHTGSSRVFLLRVATSDIKSTSYFQPSYNPKPANYHGPTDWRCCTVGTV